MQSGARWIDILIVLRAWFLESMKGTIGVIFRQSSVWLALLWQLNCLMFAQHYLDLLAKHSQFVHMRQC